jgi:hypothetical protein
LRTRRFAIRNAGTFEPIQALPRTQNIGVNGDISASSAFLKQ